MGDGLAAGGGLAGLINRDPVVFQIRGLRERGGGQTGLMRGCGIEQGLQMHLHLIITCDPAAAPPAEWVSLRRTWR